MRISLDIVLKMRGPGMIRMNEMRKKQTGDKFLLKRYARIPNSDPKKRGRQQGSLNF